MDVLHARWQVLRIIQDRAGWMGVLGCDLPHRAGENASDVCLGKDTACSQKKWTKRN